MLKKLIVLSVAGGNTMFRSKLRMTIFHNSLRSLFKTDLSQICAYMLNEPAIQICIVNVKIDELIFCVQIDRTYGSFSVVLWHALKNMHYLSVARYSLYGIRTKHIFLQNLAN